MSESFDKVFAQIRQEYASVYSVGTLARLQIAHDHDMELADKSAYHRGYVAGQKSMDAEHYAVALRLRRIRFDGGSHENLNKLAHAIYPCATGWTCESCDGLRDELIRLLGGVHDEPVSVGADCGACGADCDCGAGESRRVMYDELDNERHKAVCALKKIHADAGGFVKALANALGVEWQAPRVTQTIAEVRDRLIHLIGGYERVSQESPNLANLDGEDGGEVTITADLRKCVENATQTYDDTPWHDGSDADRTICHITEGELLRVADSIDEWFKRLCEQQEAVLQQTIDGMVGERGEGHDMLMPVDVFLRERGKLRHDVEMWRDRAEDMRMERDELQAKLERSRAEYCETCEEAETTNILRAKLDAIREALDG